MFQLGTRQLCQACRRTLYQETYPDKGRPYLRKTDKGKKCETGSRTPRSEPLTPGPSFVLMHQVQIMDALHHQPLLGQRGTDHHGTCQIVATHHLCRQDGGDHLSTHLDGNLPTEGLGETPMMEMEEVVEVEAGAEVTLQTLADHLKILTMEAPADLWKTLQMNPQTGIHNEVEPQDRGQRQYHPWCEQTHSSRRVNHQDMTGENLTCYTEHPPDLMK